MPEAITFDGKNLQPQLFLTGSGNVRFDHQAGVVRSIDREIQVKFKDEANETSYGVEIKLVRLEGDALEAFRSEEAQRKLQAEARLAEQRAKMDQVPTLADRDAVIEILKNGDDQAVETLVNKLRSDKSLTEDLEVGQWLYKRSFQTRTGLFSSSDVIKVIAPELFQSATIARQYRTGFDLSLTGDPIQTDTPLVKGQIICYPYFSRWQVGTFYAAAEDVLILQTSGIDQKLVVFLRSECRLPTPQFIDPTTIKLAE